MSGAPTPDFRAIFQGTPGLYLVLTPGFAIAEATDTWLRHTAMRREQVLGRQLFEVLAERPDEPAAGGPSELGNRLQRVLRLRQPDAMPVRCYAIPRQDGGSTERYWTLLNMPVCDEAAGSPGSSIGSAT